MPLSRRIRQTWSDMKANWPNDADKALVLAANPETVSAICRALIARTEALRELVECKDLNDESEAHYLSGDEMNAKIADTEYRRRKPAAWEAARKALAEEP